MRACGYGRINVNITLFPSGGGGALTFFKAMRAFFRAPGFLTYKQLHSAGRPIGFPIGLLFYFVLLFNPRWRVEKVLCYEREEGAAEEGYRPAGEEYRFLCHG